MKIKKDLFVLFGIIIGVTLLLPLYASAESGLTSQPTQTEETIEVELNDDYFNPKVITIPSGKATAILLKNKGKKEHTFTVEKLGIDVEVQPGAEKSITVIPNKPGKYQLVCRYHAQEGMVGEVIVK